MLIAESEGQGFRVTDSYSRIVRLGEGLASVDTLNETAIQRTLEALNVCAKKMALKNVVQSRCIATEACRRAANCTAFFDLVKRETGLTLEAISPEQEARLTLEGCSELIDPATANSLVFDIGGGSTELMWTERNETEGLAIVGMTSLPIGVVSLSERYGSEDITAETYEAIVHEVDNGLDSFDQKYGISELFSSRPAQMLGTSGTVTTLGGLYLNLPHYIRSEVDGLDMRTETIDAISTKLKKMKRSDRATIACIGPERADLVVMGCAILEAITRRWPSKTVRAADRGIREGLLLGMMREDARRTS